MNYFALSDPERDVMEHATAWHHKNRLYRNHFCAGESHADIGTIDALTHRGLMECRRHKDPGLGGDCMFVVTLKGIEALERAHV